LCKAFVKTSQQQGIAATAKHFPGHGYVKGDTHDALTYIEGEMLEVKNYIPLIDHGVLSIMIAHIAVKNNESYNTEGLPATCSGMIVTQLLKEDMGFKGIVITDAMNMGAVKNMPDASLLAVKAGCDIILMPDNEYELMEGILDEMVMPGFREQIYGSVKKVIRLKVCLGLMGD